MRKNIAHVIACFLAGLPGASPSQARLDGAGRHVTCSTDGATLFSYALPIARKVFFRGSVVRVLMIEQGKCPSATTRAQWDAVHGALGAEGFALEFVESLDHVAQRTPWVTVEPRVGQIRHGVPRTGAGCRLEERKRT